MPTAARNRDAHSVKNSDEACGKTDCLEIAIRIRVSISAISMSMYRLEHDSPSSDPHRRERDGRAGDVRLAARTGVVRTLLLSWKSVMNSLMFFVMCLLVPHLSVFSVFSSHT